MAEPAAAETRPTAPAPGGRARGLGMLLIGVYALFALSAGFRAGYQLVTRFDEATVAYLLSAVAAAVYLVAAVALAQGRRRLARGCLYFELGGVLLVGTASLVFSDFFPQATVWSGYGLGYGFVPLVLPVLGLLWLRGDTAPSTRRSASLSQPERYGSVSGDGQPTVDHADSRSVG